MYFLPSQCHPSVLDHQPWVASHPCPSIQSFLSCLIGMLNPVEFHQSDFYVIKAKEKGSSKACVEFSSVSFPLLKLANSLPMYNIC